MRQLLSVCLSLGLIAAGGNACGAAHSLGIIPPSGEQTVAFDINAAGQVAAVLEDEDGNQRGVLYDKGKLIELGSLGGKFSDAKAINDDGLIIGSARKEDSTWRAFLFEQGGGMKVLGTLGGPSSYGMALNRHGDAVGFADTADGEWHAFVQLAGADMSDLGTLGGKVSYASDINNQGQVVGTAALQDGYRRAFLYEEGRGMVNLGTLGGRSSGATAINDSGVVVGASETKDRRWHAFMHDGVRMVDLGAKIGYGNSFATGINKDGHVVGTVLVGDERMSFVWRDGKMNVHHGGVGLYLTNTINDKGLVIGAVYDRRLDAAAMRSSTPPVVPREHYKVFTFILMALVPAFAAVIFRKRYRGVDLLHMRT